MLEFANKIHWRSNAFCDVVLACKFLLKNSPNAKEHFSYIKSRISDNNIDSFNIGYFPNDKNLDELTELVDKKTLQKLKLTYNWFVNNRSSVSSIQKGLFNYHNIIFPYNDEYGNIIALAGRTLLGDTEQEEVGVPKYKNTFFNKSLHLFGLYQAKRAIAKRGCVIVVEGQIDCISCHGHGIHNVVAIGGSDLSRYQFYLIKKYSDDIYLLLDNDSAGKRATEKILDRYSKYANIRTLELPASFGDVDEYLRQSSTCDVFNLF
jgi:DNA primase